ncbi:MAG: hypothetical protein JWP00_2896 [Chloroflexi bacterium]|jgi:hypothetical protein|nr:hypothetical protein [Chloroflexota bacterium]
MELLIGFIGTVSLLAGLGWASAKYGVDSRKQELMNDKSL